MIVNFRQGIIDTQRGIHDFVNLNNSRINFNADNKATLLNFAHGEANYLVKLNKSIPGAWGIVANSYWLFWDIDLMTGQLSFGKTPVAPSYGVTFPTSPTFGQHFFDTLSFKMYVYYGQWSECIRLFAGNIFNNEFHPENIGSQINNRTTVNSDEIFFDHQNNPVRRFRDDSTFEFLTKENSRHFHLTNLQNFQFKNLEVFGTASVDIPAYKLVSWSTFGDLDLADYSRSFGAVGITEKNAIAGEKIALTTRGFVVNPSWGWTQAVNTPLFTYSNGDLTVTPPNTNSLQKVGYIVNPTTIFLNFEEQILINPVDITPTPSITPSVTATQTATPLPTPTITSSTTPSVTPPNTPTQTRTPTRTPTSTITPSVTITGTPVPTPTPTSTPANTPASTVSPTPTLTLTPTVTGTTVATPTITPTFTPTLTLTPTLSVTPSVTPTISVTPTFTPTISNSPTMTPTISVTPTVTTTATVTPTVTPTLTLTPTPT